MGIALLFIFVIFRFPFSRLALGGCSLLGFAISLDSVLNYPAEAENLAYSMVFSPEMPELYFSIVVGIGLFLTALILPRR
ncbi:hypothetical protein D3C71_1908270 [compost metagenome]